MTALAARRVPNFKGEAVRFASSAKSRCWKLSLATSAPGQVKSVCQHGIWRRMIGGIGRICREISRVVMYRQ